MQRQSISGVSLEWAGAVLVMEGGIGTIRQNPTCGVGTGACVGRVASKGELV